MHIFWSKVEKNIFLIIWVACSHILLHAFHMNPATMTFCLIDGDVRRISWVYSGFTFSLASGMWWAKCADITLCVPSQGCLAPQVLIANGPMTKLGFETRTAFLRSMFRSHHAQITISARVITPPFNLFICLGRVQNKCTIIFYIYLFVVLVKQSITIVIPYTYYYSSGQNFEA